MKHYYIKIALIILFIFFWACEKKDPVNTVAKEQPSIPDQEMWNFEVKVTNRGLLEAHLRSGHMVFYSDEKNPQSILNQGVLVDFYDKNGKRASTLTADSGMFNEKTQDVKAFRNVIVESDSGVTLFTEAIEYDQKREKIFTDLDVLITTDNGDSLWGHGFESDPQMNHWQITKLRGVAHKGMDMTQDFSKPKNKEIPDTTQVDSIGLEPQFVSPDSGVLNDES